MSGPDVCEHGNDAGKPCAQCSTPADRDAPLDVTRLAELLEEGRTTLWRESASSEANPLHWERLARWLLPRLRASLGTPAPEPSERAIGAALVAMNRDRVPPVTWPTDYTRGGELEWHRHMLAALRAAYAIDVPGSSSSPTGAPQK